MLPDECLDQRTLARAVCSEQRDHFVAFEYNRHVAHQGATMNTDRYMFCFDDAIPAAIARGEPKRHDGFRAGRR